MSLSHPRGTGALVAWTALSTPGTWGGGSGCPASAVPGVAGIDPVGVKDVLVLLPQLRPEVGIAVEALGQVPEGVATDDDVDLAGSRRGRRGRVPGRPVIADPVQLARR